MKKVINILVVLGLGFVLIGCGNGQETEVANMPYITAVSNELTIAELGDVIERAGHFWTELRTLEGRFAWEHFDHNEALGYVHLHLLPTSGFSRVEDVRNHLLQYYTENWAGIEEVWIMRSWDNFEQAFKEFGGMLYAVVASQGTWYAWETAEHRLIEQDGNHAIVETRVETRYSATGDTNLRYTTFRFTFVGNRIDSGEFVGVEEAEWGYDDFVSSVPAESNEADDQLTSDVDFSSHPIVGTWESIGFSHYYDGNWDLDDTFTGSLYYFGADGSFKMFRTGPGSHHWDDSLVSTDGIYIFQTGVWFYAAGSIHITGYMDMQGENPQRTTWHFEYSVDGNSLHTFHDHSPGGRFEYVRVN